ncbi:predicted protein [Pyrenophora tritici-repentis Pt-1C-BFP]|uniref:Uncharacterized protein n=1 Tax=Pyrenophora tritici-repentis (strain Pt-1C-BFP) TaxID=426418 RepID=B2VZE0_PYRTR|nr:uncharacterized protein PTRG_02780 [Pyrenophora tritici-repentis Pt-1C-BFP]EDU45303.1 predicted protein [Pyrenophora tritici-repentis Pt-1C-BFP]
MGRQAYLDKIAFGRSAFEPTQSASVSSEYIQLESSQSEIPARYHEASAHNYIQLYDERGNPINPRSQQYGRKLRSAQNDVLASVGVVERRRSSSHGLPGSSEERFELLEAEDTVGNGVALVTTLTENLCTWWIGTIGDRILTFRYHHALSFGQIVAFEYAQSGTSVIYAGFASRMLATMNIQTIIYSTVFLYLGLEGLCYPFFYHATLQRIGLVPARALLPRWSSLNPFSSSSPLRPFSLYYNASDSAMDCIKAALTSPVVILCVGLSLERWVYACVYEAVESSILRPDNPDISSRDVNGRSRALTALGMRRESPALVRNSIHKVLELLGWASPRTSQCTERSGPNDAQAIDVGGTRVTNAVPLNLPVVQMETPPATEPPDTDVITIPIDAIEDLMRSTTPPGSTTGLDQDENDPRIRITSREGIVEMEVRLPSRILSTHTDVAEAIGSQRGHGAVEPLNQDHLSGNPYHRVTRLSCEPAQMIGAIMRAQIVGLAMLPVRMVTMRMIALHYLAGEGRYTGPHRAVSTVGFPGSFSWQEVGVQLSRVALCGALEVTIDLGLWGLQYLAITKFGQSLFGWGSL